MGEILVVEWSEEWQEALVALQMQVAAVEMVPMQVEQMEEEEEEPEALVVVGSQVLD